MPRQRSKCKIEGCEKPHMRGALLCEDHIGTKRRCEGIVHEKDPETGEVIGERRCKRSAKPGLLVCESHGGSGPKSSEVSVRSAALTAMQRFAQPYEGDLDPISAFELEFRRTYGRILWLEEQIAAFESEQDLIWGRTKEEKINAAEYSGTNTTHEARIHGFEEMLRWERKHFLDLEKVWIGAKLEDKKLSIMRSQIDYTYSLCVNLARALGHDPSAPETRAIIGRLFERELVAMEGSDE